MSLIMKDTGEYIEASEYLDDQVDYYDNIYLVKKGEEWSKDEN